MSQYIGSCKIIPNFGRFWPLLPTWSNFYGSKWLVQVTRIKYYMFHVGPASLGGILGPKSKFCQKMPFFCCFWAKIGGSLTVGQNDFFYKIRWLIKSILALEPKFHEDWCKNGHETRQKSQKHQKWTLKTFFLKKAQDFELLKQVPKTSTFAKSAHPWDPKNGTSERPNQSSKTTFIVQTFPKYGL